MARKKNSGFSLAEVIIAIGISSVVLTFVGYMIFTGLNLFGRNNSNVIIQNESQRVTNLLKDYIKEASGLTFIAGDMRCLLLGDILITESPADSLLWDVVYDGWIVLFHNEDENDPNIPDDEVGPGKLYLIENLALINFPNAPIVVNAADNCSTPEAAAAMAITKVIDHFETLTNEQRLPWLMGEYIESINITPYPQGTPADILYNDEICGILTVNGGCNNLAHTDICGDGDYTVTFPRQTITNSGIVHFFFEEPLVLSIDIEFFLDIARFEARRSISSEMTVRNRLLDVRFADPGNGQPMRRYRRL
ncbi:MAG: prepilin-type N-terminal cleavage/methylation domain-containing protein [Lachnospiraceae bacterium]|jgi:prepilin-type N-terminal cleavage/methylation domain-containing protein|nr:prepilin-type N-terminal cleavage/methylation domain-containing protein [Lachnospiraceae bacterium]